MGMQLSGSLELTGSFTTSGTITAQTLVVQTITSSITQMTGSNVFGSTTSNVQQMTGSLRVTGSANFLTAQNFLVSSSSTGWIASFANNYNNTSYIGVDSDGMYLQPLNKGTKLVAGNGTTYLYVTSSGVGIGTTSPSQKLEVVGGEIKAGRVDSSQEGGQVSFGRASDNSTSWYIDLYGSSTSPQLRFVDVDNSAVRMTLTGSNVGIGTSDPRSLLDVRFNADRGIRFSSPGVSTEATVTSYQGNVSNNIRRLRLVGDSIYFNTGDGSDSTGTERVGIDSVGRVTITSPNTYPLTVSNTTNNSGQGVFVTSLGSNNNNTTSYHYIAATGGADKYYLYGNGTYTTVSDARLKKNITTVTDTYLDKVKNLRIVNYNWNDQPDGSQLELGMIAQEVEEVIPSIVYEGREHEDGSIYKGIQVSSLPYILIKAIQELEARVKELENK